MSIGGSNIHITHGHTVSSQIPASSSALPPYDHAGSTDVEAPAVGTSMTLAIRCFSSCDFSLPAQYRKGRGGSNSALNILEFESDCYEKHLYIMCVKIIA